MKTNYSFQIRIRGTYTGFAPNGYSKYWKRLLLHYKDKLPKDELIYGFEQAKEHLKELRNTKEHKDVPLEIIQTKTEELIIYINYPKLK